MTQKYSLELVEEHDAINFYSIHLIDEELSEFLVDTSRFIASRVCNGTLYIVEKELIGNLNFIRDEKK